MKRHAILILGVVLMAGAALLALSGPSNKSLMVFCAAGVRPPVDAAAKAYEKAYGIPIQLQYGGSQTLLASAEVAKKGDLYVPGDDSYIALARKKGLVAETIPLAKMQAVAATKKGGRKITSLADLMAADIRLGQANPDAAAIGKVVRDRLQKTGQWDAIKARTTVFKPTVNDVANDIRLGTIDAGFVWDATVRQYPDLVRVDLPELEGAVANITVGVLSSSEQPTEALRFARFLAARDKGSVNFKNAGYESVEGDAWEYTPKIRLMSGAMLRPAIEETIAAFGKREGVEIARDYEGCGNLVSKMKTGDKPDAYFACDGSFMDMVNDMYQDRLTISSNAIVILTPKGRHPEIKALADLAAPGLKIGLGHPAKSALGALTKKMLENANLYEKIKANTAVESATGDLLVNQVRTGSLDAVIVYQSNAAKVREHVDLIPIDLPDARAVQPVAICRYSPRKQTLARLVEAIKSASSKERFQSNGFLWKAD